MARKPYELMEVETVRFDAEDVIATSGNENCKCFDYEDDNPCVFEDGCVPNA